MNVFITGIDMSDGKSVLLLAPEQMDEADTLHLKTVLTEKFPAVNWVVLSGGFQAIASTGSDLTYELGDE